MLSLQNADMSQKSERACRVPHVQGASLTAVQVCGACEASAVCRYTVPPYKGKAWRSQGYSPLIDVCSLLFFSPPPPRTLFSLVIESALRSLQSYPSRVLTLHTSPETSPRLGCTFVIKKKIIYTQPFNAGIKVKDPNGLAVTLALHKVHHSLPAAYRGSLICLRRVMV